MSTPPAAAPATRRQHPRRGALLAVDEAAALVAACAERLPAEPVGLYHAQGRTLAGDVVAPVDSQPFANSSMDGYAVRAGDGPRLRLLAHESRAGSPSGGAVGPGEALAISTGAPLPEGADAVVPVEHAGRDGDTVVVSAQVRPGANVRRAGEDFRAGSVILRAGDRVGPAELSVLAKAGLAAVPCVRRPRVNLMVTGDELVPPGGALGPGQVHESNLHALSALVAESGGVVERRVWASDEPGSVDEAVGELLRDADLALASGGVSVGRHDHVRPAFLRHGAGERFWGVALRPGKPTWFGTAGPLLVFGLPGNPVSAAVTFELLVRPALDVMLGRDGARRRTEARLAVAYDKPAGRLEAVRCRLELTPAGWTAVPTADQGSHVSSSLVGADAFALLPAEAEHLPRGARVSIVLRTGAFA